MFYHLTATVCKYELKACLGSSVREAVPFSSGLMPMNGARSAPLKTAQKAHYIRGMEIGG
jgi:hypothetical protein